MLKIMQGAWATFFGPSSNDQLVKLLREISSIGLECSAHFRKTQGADVPSIIV